MQRRHFEVLADAMAAGYQFGVEPFQRPEAYTQRRDAWRKTVAALVANLTSNNVEFNGGIFRQYIADRTGVGMRRLFEE